MNETEMKKDAALWHMHLEAFCAQIRAVVDRIAQLPPSPLLEDPWRDMRGAFDLAAMACMAQTLRAPSFEAGWVMRQTVVAPFATRAFAMAFRTLSADSLLFVEDKEGRVFYDDAVCALQAQKKALSQAKQGRDDALPKLVAPVEADLAQQIDRACIGIEVGAIRTPTTLGDESDRRVLVEMHKMLLPAEAAMRCVARGGNRTICCDLARAAYGEAAEAWQQYLTQRSTWFSDIKAMAAQNPGQATRAARTVQNIGSVAERMDRLGVLLHAYNDRSCAQRTPGPLTGPCLAPHLVP